MFDFSGLFEHLDFGEQGNLNQNQGIDDFTRKRLNITDQGDVGKAAKSYRGLMEKNLQYDAATNRDRLTNQALGRDLQGMEEGQYQNVLEDLKQISSPTGFDITSDVGSREDQIADLKNYVASVKEEAEVAGQTREKQLELGKLYNDLAEQTKGNVADLKSLGEEEFSGLIEKVQQSIEKTDLSNTNISELNISRQNETETQPFASLGREDQVEKLVNYTNSIQNETNKFERGSEERGRLSNILQDLSGDVKTGFSRLEEAPEEEWTSFISSIEEKISKADLTGTSVGLFNPRSSENKKSFSSLGREEQMEKLRTFSNSVQNEINKFEQGSSKHETLNDLYKDLSTNIQEGTSNSQSLGKEEWNSFIENIENRINNTDLSDTNVGSLTPQPTQQQSLSSLPREEQIQKITERQTVLESDTKNLSNQRSQNIREFASQLNPATSAGLFESLINNGRQQMGNEVKTRTTPELITELFNEDKGSLRNAFSESGGAGIKTPKSEEDFQDLFEKMKPEKQEGFREQIQDSVRKFRERQANFFVNDIQRMEDEVSNLQQEMLSQSDDEFLARIRQLRETNEISGSQARDITSMPREEAVSQYGRMISNAEIQQPSHWQSIGEETPTSIQSTYDNMMGQESGSGGSADGTGGSSSGIADAAAAYGMGMAGGTLSGAAAGGVGGGSGRGGTTAGAAPSPGDRGGGKQEGGKRGGGIGGFLQGKGGSALAGGLALGGFLSDVATPGGRSGAETLVGGASSMGTPLGAAAGLMLTGGNPAGAAIGGMAGQYMGQAVGQAAQPYLQYQQSQRSIQQITGEEQDRSVGSMMGTMFGGGDSVQGAQTQARWSNPFLPTEEIQKLTDQMLQLGASTEQAAEAIGPATSAINEFAMSSELAGTLAVTGMLPGNQFGSQNPYYVGKRIQEASEGGMTQQSIGNLVQSTTQNLGPTIGYENAPGAAISTATTLSRGGMESDMIFEQQQTGQKLIQGMGAAANDVGTASMLGVDPNLSPQEPAFETQTREGQIELVRRMTDSLPKDEDGNLTVTARNTLQSQLQSYAPALGNMSVDEAEEIAKGNITPEQARKDSQQQNKQDRRDEADLKRRASGAIKKGSRPEEKEGFGGLMNRIPGTQTFLDKDRARSDIMPVNTLGRDARSLFKASSEESGEKSYGPLGVISAHEKGFDPSKVRTANGESLQQITDDPKKIKRLNEGKLKLNIGGEEMSARQLSEKMIKDEAYVGEKGGIKLGQKEGGGGGKGENVKIDLTDRAAKLIEVKDIRGNGGMAAEVQAAQDRYARNHKGQQLNDSPRFG